MILSMIFYQVHDYHLQAFIKYKNGIIRKSSEERDELRGERPLSRLFQPQ